MLAVSGLLLLCYISFFCVLKGPSAGGLNIKISTKSYIYFFMNPWSIPCQIRGFLSLSPDILGLFLRSISSSSSSSPNALLLADILASTTVPPLQRHRKFIVTHFFLLSLFFSLLFQLYRIYSSSIRLYFPSSTNPLGFPLTTPIEYPTPQSDSLAQSLWGRVVQWTDLIQHFRTQQPWHVLILLCHRYALLNVVRP